MPNHRLLDTCVSPPAVFWGLTQGREWGVAGQVHKLAVPTAGSVWRTGPHPVGYREGDPASVPTLSSKYTTPLASADAHDPAAPTSLLRGSCNIMCHGCSVQLRHMACFRRALADALLPGATTHSCPTDLQGVYILTPCDNVSRCVISARCK
jgi:hypothetical protein